MANVYGVVPADIAEELRNLFPQGFSATTVPTINLVTEWIATADMIVRLRVTAVASGTPSSTDAAAQLAKTYIKNAVIGRVLRTVYAGNDPVAVASVARAYEDSAKMDLSAI